MKIELKKFGDILTSRQDGREALAAAGASGGLAVRWAPRPWGVCRDDYSILGPEEVSGDFTSGTKRQREALQRR